MNLGALGNKLKEWSDYVFLKLRLFRYYMENPKHPISFLGILLDIFFINIFIWAFLYLWIVYRTKSPSLSLFLSLSIILLLDIALFIKKHKDYEKNRKNRRREIVKSHLSNRISQLNCQEFQLHLVRLMHNCKNFSKIDKDKELLIADYNGTSVAVGFHHPPPGGATDPGRVWEFVHQVRNHGLEHGIFISSSSFEENCTSENIKKLGLSIRLLDFSYLIDMMEKAHMLPDEATIDLLIKGEIRKKKNHKGKIKKEILSPNKIKQYLFFSFLFLLAGLLIQSYNLYYYMLSLLFITLAMLTKILATTPSENSEYPADILKENPKEPS